MTLSIKNDTLLSLHNESLFNCKCKGDFISALHSLRYIAQNFTFKITEAALSKLKDLSLSDKSLVIEKVEKKLSQSTITKKLETWQPQVT